MEHPVNNETYKGLVVNAGVEQPASVNPYLKRKPKKRTLSVNEFVEGITKGDVTILSQAVTLVESIKSDHQQVAQEVIEKCLPYSGNSIRVGISGVPGAGKSTSIDVFGLHVLEKYAGKLAVLAIDPSSERSKGSILGDKTRMDLGAQPRSLGSKIWPLGLSYTKFVIDKCEVIKTGEKHNASFMVTCNVKNTDRKSVV